MTSFSRRSSWALAGAAGLWLAVVASGLLYLLAYDVREGDRGDPPARWPAESALEPGRDGVTLIFFAHPRCPCTRAGIAELNKILTRATRPVTTHALFYAPEGEADAWAQTDLWRAAAALPGVQVAADRDGVESRRFRLHTSGHLLAYDAEGRLRFSGGVTSSRGHHGDNPSAAAVVALLTRGSTPVQDGAVFGCSLRGDACPPAASSISSHTHAGGSP